MSATVPKGKRQAFAVPMQAVMLGREQVEGWLAWQRLRERWESAGLVLTPDGRLEVVAD